MVVGTLTVLLALAVWPPAGADPLVATIADVAGSPSLTLAPGGRAVLVDRMGARARIVDTATGRVIGTLAVGGAGAGAGAGAWLPVADDAGLRRAFVAWPAAPRPSGTGVTIAAIDLPSGRAIGSATAPLPPQSLALDAYLATDARRHRLFVLPFSYPATSLLTVDTARLRVLRTVALSPWRAGGGSWEVDSSPLAVDEATGRVFVGRIDEDAVSVLDATSGRLLRTIALPPPLPSNAGLGTQVACPLIDAARARVYVPDPAADAVTTLDARTGAIVRTVRLAARPAGPILDAAAGRVFVPYQSLSGYAVLDAWSGRLVRASAPGRGLALAAAALDEGRQRAFVADDAGGTVATDDLRTGRTLRTVGVGIHPSKLAFDRPRDRVLVTDAGPCCAHGQPTGNGALVVLDGASGRAMRTLPLGRGPLQPLVDAPTGRVLVVNAGGGVATDPDPWGWIPRPIRQRLSMLPRPRRRTVAGSVMIFDLTRVAQG